MTAAGSARRTRIVRNTAAQVIGRNAIALLRLVVAGLIVRSFGAQTFGEYSLLLGILTVAEWLADFGTSETSVRDISADPERTAARLSLLMAGKLGQVPAAFGVLALVLLVLGYPAHLVTAGLVGGISLVLFGGILVYRVLFRARLTMEREAVAELGSVLALIPMVAMVGHVGGGLIALMACHVLSRAAYLGASCWLGRHQFRPSIAGVHAVDVRASLRSASLIGAIGLLAGIYELADLLVLSKLASLTEVAHYSAAQRLSWPVLMALASIAGTLYPVAASYWPGARSAFEGACQRGVDTVVVLGGLAFSALLAGPEFFLGLLGEELVVAAPVLRVMAVLCLVKAITSTVGPLLYVVNAQRSALRFVIASVLLKAVVLVPLAFRFGALGVAAGALVVEVLWAVGATVYLFQRFSGYRFQWAAAVKAVVGLAVAVAVSGAMFPAGGLSAAVAAPVAFAPLMVLMGAVRLSDVQVLLRREA